MCLFLPDFWPLTQLHMRNSQERAPCLFCVGWNSVDGLDPFFGQFFPSCPERRKSIVRPFFPDFGPKAWRQSVASQQDLNPRFGFQSHSPISATVPILGGGGQSGHCSSLFFAFSGRRPKLVSNKPAESDGPFWPTISALDPAALAGGGCHVHESQRFAGTTRCLSAPNRRSQIAVFGVPQMGV